MSICQIRLCVREDSSHDRSPHGGLPHEIRVPVSQMSHEDLDKESPEALGSSALNISGMYRERNGTDFC